MTARCIIFISLSFAVSAGGVAQDSMGLRTFAFRELELRSALDTLYRWYAVPLIYLDTDVAGKKVSAECRQCNFQDALEKVIDGKGLVWMMVDQQVLLQQKAAKPVDTPATLAGTLRDSVSGQAIPDANVVLIASGRAYRWCSTNQFGFFSLRNIRAGTYTLDIRRIGYRAIREPVIFLQGSSILRDIPLSEHHIFYPEMTIEGNRSSLPVTGGISRGMYIRGTPSDDNQYLLDGARIYNPLHFGGVMNAFNAGAMRDVQVVSGGIPPSYGGRIGGILDVVLRNGSNGKVGGSASAGSLSSSLLVEGPVVEGTTFMMSGRRNYPDALLPSPHAPQARSDLNSTELIAKLSQRLGGNQRVALSGYFGADRYGRDVGDPSGSRLLNALQWGNTAVSGRWIGAASPSLFFYTSAAYTRYAFDIEQREAGLLPAEAAFASDFAIQDAAIRAHAEYFYDEYHTVLAGMEFLRHWMSGAIGKFSSQIAPMSFDGLSPWELSVYMQDQWRLVPSVSAEIGARATSFVAEQGSFSAIEPRFSLLVAPGNDLRWYCSFSTVNEFMHPYRNSGLFLYYPSIFFYPSTENVRPTTSLQVSLGMEDQVDEGKYRLAVETYYRRTQNLHEFLSDTATGSLMNALIFGEGNAYGVDVTLDKRTGDLTGSVRYSFSYATDRFAQLNGGEPFRPRFDRRHELYGSLTYSPNEGWAAGVSCLLASNQFPSPRFLAPKGVTGAGPLDGMGAAKNAAGYAEPYDLNGARLPGFERLEIYGTRSFWWGVPFEATLRLINGYGILDPFVWQVGRNTDVRRRWSVAVDAPPIFPLYPVVSLSARF